MGWDISSDRELNNAIAQLLHKFKEKSQRETQKRRGNSRLFSAIADRMQLLRA